MDLIEWHFRDQYVLEGYYDDKLPFGTNGPNGFPIFGTTAQGCTEIVDSATEAFLALGTYRSWRACEMLTELRRSVISRG